MSRGRLAVVLHTHMPYVEGFGTWPFGEEWLWEAMATSYLPLLDLLDAGAPLTLSLTPVLCDQLEAPGVAERFRAFLTEVRPATHRLDAEEARGEGDGARAAELERAAGDYQRALERFDAVGGDLLGALGLHAAWTSAATHAVLPLLATEAGVRFQLATGIAAHRRRSGAPWRGGLWLPECAYAPWLEPLLAEAGVRATCLDLSAPFGVGAPDHLRPLRSPHGPLLVPIDRASVELVWSDRGYPSHAAYRDSHRTTRYERRPWANDGSVYDPDRAAARVAADAEDFLARARERLAGGGLCVCALDTELLGHWWHEGVAWLAAVVERAAEAGVELVALDDALEDVEAEPRPHELPVCSWGQRRDLSTWDSAAAAELLWAARRAELDVVLDPARAPDRALRELLALQSSDWAFGATLERAGPYPRERALGHARAFAEALGDGSAGEPGLRALAPQLARSALFDPS